MKAKHWIDALGIILLLAIGFYLGWVVTKSHYKDEIEHYQKKGE